MQEVYRPPVRRKISPVVVVLLVLLLLQILAAELLAGLYLYRIYSRPVRYSRVERLCEELDSAYIAENPHILLEAGYVFVEEDAYGSFYLPADSDGYSGMRVYIYKDSTEYAPYFNYQKDYLSTLIPWGDGYSFVFDDGVIYLEMYTYAGDSVFDVYSALNDLVKATAVEHYPA